jgi:four helix bundle protein
VRNVRALEVWHRRHRQLPRQETCSLIAQLHRFSASIPANIAEGCGRSGEAELARHAHRGGSASESEYHLLLAHDLGYLATRDHEQLSQETREIN